MFKRGDIIIVLEEGQFKDCVGLVQEVRNENYINIKLDIHHQLNHEPLTVTSSQIKKATLKVLLLREMSYSYA